MTRRAASTIQRDEGRNLAPASRRRTAPGPGHQRGMGLATALFVITVMAVLAVLIAQLVRNNAQAAGEELRLVRAFYAAQSGIEFALNGVFPPSGVGGGCPAPTPVFAPPTLSVEGLNECQVQVQCAVVTESAEQFYTLTSQGTCGEVSRTLQVRAH